MKNELVKDLVEKGQLPELPTSVSFDTKSVVTLCIALLITAAAVILINKIVKGL